MSHPGGWRENPYLTPADVETAVESGVLNLSGRDIDVLPDWIGELSGLEQLRLDRNRLGHLRDSIGNLANLKQLWL